LDSLENKANADHPHCYRILLVRGLHGQFCPPNAPQTRHRKSLPFSRFAWRITVATRSWPQGCIWLAGHSYWVCIAPTFADRQMSISGRNGPAKRHLAQTRLATRHLARQAKPHLARARPTTRHLAQERSVNGPVGSSSRCLPPVCLLLPSKPVATTPLNSACRTRRLVCIFLLTDRAALPTMQCGKPSPTTARCRIEDVSPSSRAYPHFAIASAAFFT
jgi:hypothetical protein